jgi:hypothetical protein
MAVQYSDRVLKAMEDAEKRILGCFAQIGAATLSWNSAEEALERFIWYYLRSDEVGHIVTSKLHNVGRLDVLRNLVDACESVADIRTRIDHFLDAFDILRLNRNVIVHSVSFSLHGGEETFNFERLKKSIRTREYDTYSMPLETLEKLNEQIEQLISFGKTVLLIMQRRTGLIDQPYFDWKKPPPWPDIFPLPEKLSSLQS